jgi:hypothetical protein
MLRGMFTRDGVSIDQIEHFFSLTFVGLLSSLPTAEKFFQPRIRSASTQQIIGKPEVPFNISTVVHNIPGKWVFFAMEVLVTIS